VTTYVRTSLCHIDAGGPLFVLAEVGVHHNRDPLTVTHL